MSNYLSGMSFLWAIKFKLNSSVKNAWSTKQMIKFVHFLTGWRAFFRLEMGNFVFVFFREIVVSNTTRLFEFCKFSVFTKNFLQLGFESPRPPC